jgi:DNA-directed RNA polymerase specialized sigma24 family protein
VYDRRRGKFRGYLKVCTVHAIVKRMGKQARLGGRALIELDPESLAVEQVWSDLWEHELLQRALAETRDHYSGSEVTARTFEAFVEYVLREKPAARVAEDLGLAVGSVHMAKLRVTSTLRRILNELRHECE